MVRLLSRLLLLTVFAVPVVLAGTDFWMAAREGKVACVSPNLPMKTCVVMTSFVWETDGTVTSIETGGFPSQPDLTITASTKGRVQGPKFCYVASKDAFDVVSIKRAGVPIPASEFEKFEDAFTEISRPIYGSEFCAEFEFSEVIEFFTVQMFLDGSPIEDGRYSGVWVDVDDGFKLQH